MTFLKPSPSDLTMKITLQRLDEHFHLEARNASHNSLQMDASPAIGGSEKGLRPMEVLLSSLGGCSSIDVILLLKKQRQEISFFEVELEGIREERGDHAPFRNIHLHFKIGGRVDRNKAERAVSLSLEKYCTVARILEPGTHITHSVSIH